MSPDLGRTEKISEATDVAESTRNADSARIEDAQEQWNKVDPNNRHIIDRGFDLDENNASEFIERNNDGLHGGARALPTDAIVESHLKDINERGGIVSSPLAGIEIASSNDMQAPNVPSALAAKGLGEASEIPAMEASASEGLQFSGIRFADPEKHESGQLAPPTSIRIAGREGVRDLAA